MEDLLLRGEWEEDLRAMVGRVFEVCRVVKKSTQIRARCNEGKRLECKVFVDGMQLERVLAKCFG